MHPILAQCITKLVKNKTKKQVVYDLLTRNTINANMGGGIH